MARLHESKPDDISLCTAVEVKFLELCGLYERVKFAKLQISPDMKTEFKLWRTMRLRHKQGDWRHSKPELKATKAVAQWTLNLNNKLRNQPQHTLQWDDSP